MLPKLLPVALVVAATTPQYTVQPQKVEMPSTNLLHLYSGKYWAVKDRTRFSPGADLRRSKTPVSAGTYRRSIRVLDDYVKAERQLDQPAPAVTASSDATGAPITVSFTQAAPSGGLAACVAQLESGGDPTRVNGSGHMGLYQFDQQTWNAAGGSGSPLNASPAEQTARFTYWYSLHPDAWSQTAPRC